MPAQRWLAEAGQALQPRYHFVHCKDFDASGGPSRLWLMSMTGMSPSIMLEIYWKGIFYYQDCQDRFLLLIADLACMLC